MDFQEIFNKAYVRSLEYLSLMPRTCSEVNKKLSLLLNNLSYSLDEEIKTEIVESVISKLTSEGLLDDTQFATTYVTQRISSSKPKSKGEIRNFLYKKGIPAHITDHALEMYTSDDEIAAIKKIIAKKNFSDKKKIKQYLYSRGFNINLIADLLS
jgi:regulatory protein